MLRKLLDKQMHLFDKGRKMHKMRPLASALDNFMYEAPNRATKSPFVRDAVDLKRWMVLVVIALLPCCLWAIWNTGVQKLVFTSADFRVMNAYMEASTSWSGYFDFCFADGRWLTILQYGLGAFLPIVLISYIVGGAWEVFFAIVRRHEVAEGFLVTGILFPLSLPATIPYWMVAMGVSFGVVVGKELFGGTGMNILNPALTCRAFLFFAYPAQMTGQIWAGTNATVVASSVRLMNEQAETAPWDGYTEATPLALFNDAGDEIKRVHVDAIATNTVGLDVPTIDVIEQHYTQWEGAGSELGALTGDQLQSFVTGPLSDGGLGLPTDSYDAAFRFSGLEYGQGNLSDWNLFWGNRLGSMGSTSIFCSVVGALVLLYFGLAAWRTMVAMGIGALVTAWIFEFSARFFGVDGGAWNPARFGFPAYKHLILGALMFGLVFMATEPVTSPTMNRAKWFYGGLIGAVTVFIRVINPAYPEGVMLAILFGNVLAPLFDHIAAARYRRVRKVEYAKART